MHHAAVRPTCRVSRSYIDTYVEIRSTDIKLKKNEKKVSLKTCVTGRSHSFVEDAGSFSSKRLC